MWVPARAGLRPASTALHFAASPLQGRVPSTRLLLHSAANNSSAHHSMSLAPPDLWDRVVSTYQRAQETGAATQTDTKVELLHDGGVDFVIRIAEALKNKPKGPNADPPGGQSSEQSQAQKPAWRNPFLPYEEALHVAHLSDTHTLLLNKFNVVPYHVLVVTRAFESQKDSLNAKDLDATWAVLNAMPTGGLAFYNCGDLSGRSQPHKHVQIVPLPVAERQPHALPIQPMVEAAFAESSSESSSQAPLAVTKLPFRAYAVQLGQNVTAEELGEAAAALCKYCQQHGPSDSYNVIMTHSFMMAVPRSHECVGPCSLNSLAYAGTTLVKSAEEMEYVKRTGPMNMLASAGVPW